MKTPEIKDGHHPTLNEMGGISSKISQLDEIFIKITTQPKSKVLDIGVAYGLVCLKALNRSAKDYTAVDLEVQHLQLLAKRVVTEMPQLENGLSLICGDLSKVFNDLEKSILMQYWPTSFFTLSNDKCEEKRHYTELHYKLYTSYIMNIVTELHYDHYTNYNTHSIFTFVS